MNKKAKVKMLLDFLSEVKNIPTNADNAIDMEKLDKVPEVKSVITLLKSLKVDGEYLRSKGFIPAHLVLSGYL